MIICAIQGLGYLIKSPTEVETLVAPTIADSQQLEGMTQSVQIQTTTPTNSTPAQSRLVAQASGNSRPEAATSSNSATPNPPPKDKLVEVGITVKDESWVLIEVDGQTEFEGTLSGGTQKSWKAKQELVVVAGNAGGVMITVNDGEAQRLGEPGMVEEVVFKADKPKTETENPKS